MRGHIPHEPLLRRRKIHTNSALRILPSILIVIINSRCHIALVKYFISDEIKRAEATFSAQDNNFTPNFHEHLI